MTTNTENVSTILGLETHEGWSVLGISNNYVLDTAYRVSSNSCLCIFSSRQSIMNTDILMTLDTYLDTADFSHSTRSRGNNKAADKKNSN